MKRVYVFLMATIASLGISTAYTNDIDNYYQQMWGNFDPYLYQDRVYPTDTQYPNETLLYDATPVINRPQDHNCKVYAGNPIGYPYFRNFGLRIPYERQHITRYRIRRYNNTWSKWYRLGQDDINQYPGKFGYPVRLRANFDDHEYQYMTCRSPSEQYPQNIYKPHYYGSNTKDSFYVREKDRSDYIQRQEATYRTRRNNHYGYNSPPQYQWQGTTTNQSDSIKADPDRAVDLEKSGFPGDGNYYGRLYFQNPQSNSPKINIPHYGNDYVRVPLR